MMARLHSVKTCRSCVESAADFGSRRQASGRYVDLGGLQAVDMYRHELVECGLCGCITCDQQRGM